MSLGSLQKQMFNLSLLIQTFKKHIFLNLEFYLSVR